MKTIAFTAQAFGFGPVSKMLAVSESISKNRKIFFGSGTAYDLAKLHSFDQVYYLEHDDQDTILEILRQSDLFVNVMDFTLCTLAKKVGCYQILIDSLLWFWQEIPQEVSLADQYLCQEFFGKTRERLQKLQLHNAKVIGPIVQSNFIKMPQIDQAVINFGGMESHLLEVGKNTNYPFVILENLLPLLQNIFPKILVVGREHIMQMCQDRFSKSNITFAQLPRATMLEEIYQSQVFFTVPGIQSFYDGVGKAPIFLLPPQSSSNRRNLKTLIENKVVSNYFQWEEVYDFDQEEVDEVAEINQVLEKLRLFSTDDHAQKYFREKVIHFLKHKDSFSPLLNSQNNGLSVVIQLIEDALAAQGHSVAPI